MNSSPRRLTPHQTEDGSSSLSLPLDTSVDKVLVNRMLVVTPAEDHSVSTLNGKEDIIGKEEWNREENFKNTLIKNGLTLYIWQ